MSVFRVFLRGQKFGFVVRPCCVRCKQPLLYICFELEQHEHEAISSQPRAHPPTNILFQQKFLGSLSARSYLPEVQISSHADLFPSGPLLKCWFGLISPPSLGAYLVLLCEIVGGCDCGRKCPSRIRGLGGLNAHSYYCNAITTL